MTANFRIQTFHIAVLLATLALAALNSCHFQKTQSQAPRLEAYDAQNATCTEWSDGCRVCRRGAGGAAAACSLPGIACVRGPIVCEASEP